MYIEPTQQASPNRVILCGVTSHYKTPGWVLIHSVKNAQLEEIRSRTLRSKLLKRMPKTKESNNNTSSVTIPKSFTTAAPLFNTNSVLKSEESPQCVVCFFKFSKSLYLLMETSLLFCVETSNQASQPSYGCITSVFNATRSTHIWP